MELRVLKYFVTVVQEGNISNASHVLHISQSTLSRQLQAFENELNTTLFERGKRTIKLTDDGQYMYSRALEILQIADNAEDTIKSGDLVQGSITIGLGENYITNIVAEVAQELISNYPGIQIKLHNLPSDLIPNEIDRGTLDFGFATSQKNLDDFYQLNFPKEDHWGVVIPKNHYLAAKEQIHPRDLQNEHILVGSQGALINNLQQWCQQDNINLKIAGYYDMSEVMKSLVKYNVGVAITFDKEEYHDSNNQFTFRPLIDFPTTKSKMIWKKGRPQSKLEQAFLKCIKGKC